MSQFNRKGESNQSQSSGSQEPDFSVLEGSTGGFSAGQLEEPASGAISKSSGRATQEVSQSASGDIFSSSDAESVQPSSSASESKKRYYNPGEVMKKKGCIGCGGMVLAVPLLLAAIGAAIALL